MKVSVIIPNYNGEKYIENCLKSIYKQTYRDFEVILVDNHSEDKSMNIIKTKYPQVKTISNDNNEGFSKAVNQGIRVSKGRYIALLNNDVEVEKDWLCYLVKHIESDKQLFAVSSKMLRFYDRDIIDDAGDNYTILGWAYKIGDGEQQNKYTKAMTIFSACGGASLYRKSIFKEIGFFDEHFFAYMEDVDIAYRAKIYDYYNAFCPKAIVYHIGSATTGSKYNEFKIKLAARNNVFVAYKNMPLVQLIVNLPFLIIGDIIKTAFFYKKGYGNIYIMGKLEGLKKSHKLKRVPFNVKYIKNYIKIEIELIMNTLKYGFAYLNRFTK